MGGNFYEESNIANDKKLDYQFYWFSKNHNFIKNHCAFAVLRDLHVVLIGKCRIKTFA